MSKNNRPQSWGKEHNLPDNWGKQGSVFESKTLSGGVSMSSSETDKKSDVKAEDKVSFSDKAFSGAGKLVGIAKKVGGAAKNAADNAVEYAKSDDAKEKLNVVKNKAKSIAAGAGSAFTDLKEKTENAINERRSSKVESALSDNDKPDNFIEDKLATDTYEDTSSDVVQPRNVYDESIDVPDLNSAFISESDESSDTLENGALSADRQDIPDTSTEDEEDSAWGNSSSPFKKNEPVSSSDTNSKTNSQSNSVTSNANNNACVASIHDAPVHFITCSDFKFFTKSGICYTKAEKKSSSHYCYNCSCTCCRRSRGCTLYDEQG